MAKGPSLSYLWTYGCELTVGRNVSGLAFNPENPDLLAICYSEHDFTTQNDGYVRKIPSYLPHLSLTLDTDAALLTFALYGYSYCNSFLYVRVP